ncbi:hypothetical protein [Dyella agri]|uniref:DUF1648 domain-containing protein n=1 Tax=Dyella agri TaxID=1926869 RepID=A0ABW8KAN8_9GAMM
MPSSLKWNAVVVAALAMMSWCAFMFAKHDPALRPIIPFGGDPYDAVGSFAVLGGAVLALLSLVRAIRPGRAVVPAAAELHLLRCETAVVLTVYAMLASDVIAMARHPSAWLGLAAGNLLVALIITMSALATGTLLLIKRSARNPHTAAPLSWRKAVLVASACVLALFFYPEAWVSTLFPHLLTIVFGDVILFAPIGLLLPAMFPEKRGAVSADALDRHPIGWVRWGVVTLVGIGLGLVVFAGEMSGGGPPAGRLVLVASVYVGLIIAAILIAYAFLAKPIGLAS